jgi:hypothetical protein
MRQDDLDRILSKEQEIIPSSGFVNSVMDSVRREALTSAPIPFPWTRALPGLASVVVSLGLLLIVGGAAVTRGVAAQSQPLALPFAYHRILEAPRTIEAGWIVLALLLSLASAKLSIRLTTLRG